MVKDLTMINVGITQESIIPHDPKSIKVGIDIVLENAFREMNIF